MAVSNYSTNPDQNTTISGINIAEGCPPSGINNAIRQLMADVKAESDDVRVDVSTAQTTANEAKTAAQNAASAASTAQSTADAASATASAALPLAGGTMSGVINMNGVNITGISHLVFSSGAELWVS